MDEKRSLEALRDLLPILEQDAVYLGQYGHLSVSLDIFQTLSTRDQRRLVALGLSMGSGDAQAVAAELLCRLDPEPGTLPELFGQMLPEDVREIQSLAAAARPVRRVAFTMADYARILEELQFACRDMSSKDLEEAHWILIAEDLDEDADWIDAMGGRDELFTTIGSTQEVKYAPGYQERLALLADMRLARWVIHVHNHPLHGNNDALGFFPSDKDLRFASAWKSIRPEIGGRMLFFVIHAGRAIEYSLPHNQLRQWI